MSEFGLGGDLLDKKSLEFLKGKKALLAFSGGVDSSGLFYLLVRNKVEFDIAFVNYNSRKESILEEEYARNLAFKFDKKIYIKSVKFSLLNTTNFEKKARDIRHEFFSEICKDGGYTALILAHQLNDRLEWFLMRLSKGAGVSSLAGMKSIEKREHFAIIRPLLGVSRDEILEFLTKNGLKYFIDSSNSNEKFERNFMRINFSDKFISKFRDGVKKSFEFLENDREILEMGEIYSDGEFFVLENLPNSMNLVDKAFKKLGVVMSEKQRLEARKDGVISGKIAIGYSKDRVYIAPFIKVVMDKKFREICRARGVPRLIRPYIFLNQNLLKWF